MIFVRKFHLLKNIYWQNSDSHYKIKKDSRAKRRKCHVQHHWKNEIKLHEWVDSRDNYTFIGHWKGTRMFQLIGWIKAYVAYLSTCAFLSCIKEAYQLAGCLFFCCIHFVSRNNGMHQQLNEEEWKHVNMPQARQMTKVQKTKQGDNQENIESG